MPAVETDGTVRDGAWVIELTDLIDHHWGDGTRVIARRERPHPGAQLTLFDIDNGFRHQLFITDQTDTDIAALELRHRHRAHVENRIRAAKDTGLRNLPCDDFVCNDTWLQLVLIAQDLHAWAQRAVLPRCPRRRRTETAPSPRAARRRHHRPHRPPDRSCGSSTPGPGSTTSSSPSNGYASPFPADPPTLAHDITLTAHAPTCRPIAAAAEHDPRPPTAARDDPRPWPTRARTSQAHPSAARYRKVRASEPLRQRRAHSSQSAYRPGLLYEVSASHLALPRTPRPLPSSHDRPREP